MSTAECIYHEVQSLPEDQARKVLDFVAYLKARRAEQTSEQDMTVFDRFGAVYDGQFNRDELYDREVLR
jgi:hypothetical protein